MSVRPCPWRQKPPDGFDDLVAAVSSVRMLLLQEIGPTSFVIKEAERNEGDVIAGVPPRDPPPQEPVIGDEVAATALAAGYPATAAAAAAAAAEARVGGARAVNGAAPAGARRRRAGDDKFKVQIGSSMKCSCKSKGEGPCIHLLFVLLKILRVPPENPFLWQGSLLDHEIDQVLRGRYQLTSIKRKKPAGSDAAKEGVQAKLIEPGDVCAICQEDLCDDEGELLTENGPMVYCKQSCGNSVHAKCMKVWAEHKASVGDKITCPFCREDWGPGAVETIKKEIRQSRRPPNVHYGITCSACKAGPITGNRFRCLVCADFDLCERCFMRQSHKDQGHPFVSRPTVDSSWAPATRLSGGHAAGRGRAAAEEPAVPAELIHNLQSRELGVDDYELLLQLDVSHAPMALHQHLAAALPHPSDAEVSAACARGDGLCVLCSTPVRMGSGAHTLSKAPCGAVLHQSCVQAHLAVDSSFLCPCCSDPLFNGLRPPGRAPIRAQAQPRAGAAAAGTGNGSQHGLQVGGGVAVGGHTASGTSQAAPRMRGRQDRSPAARAYSGGSLTELSMTVTGRHVGHEETTSEDDPAASVHTHSQRSQSTAGGNGSYIGGTLRGVDAGMSTSGVSLGVVGVTRAGSTGVTSGDRLRAEAPCLVNARMQRMRRDARHRDPAVLPGSYSTADVRGEGPMSLQVSARHLAASGVVLSNIRGTDSAAAAAAAGVQLPATPHHLSVSLVTPPPATAAAAAASAAEARLAAATDDVRDGGSASPRAQRENSAGTGRVAGHDLAHGNSRRGQPEGGSVRRVSGGRPPRVGISRSASSGEEAGRGVRRGGSVREGGSADGRGEDVNNFFVGVDVETQVEGGSRSHSLTARSGAGMSGQGVGARVRRNTSTGSIAAAMPTAAAGAHSPGAPSMELGFGVGGPRGTGLLPDLSGPRPASDPPAGGGRRAVESLRAREARGARERDHLDGVRERKREVERQRERERVRERDITAVQAMMLGGSGIQVGDAGVGNPAMSSTAAAHGKVGRHVNVGRRHVGRGQLRPLNNRAVVEGLPMGLYETSLS